MFFLNTFLPGKKAMDDREKQIVKQRLEARRRYYSEKLNYLSGKQVSPRLAVLTCRDAPAAIRPTLCDKNSKNFIRACARYYQREVKKVNAQLKKI